ncbi:MAG: hypothetical protein ACO1OB_14675 [Archangium sp.]
MKQRRLKIPTEVLERAKQSAESRKPVPPPQKPKARAPLAREKVIAALKKLHPMD